MEFRSGDICKELIPGWLFIPDVDETGYCNCPVSRSLYPPYEFGREEVKLDSILGNDWLDKETIGLVREESDDPDKLCCIICWFGV